MTSGDRVSVAIIGLGPRGLSVLERLATLASGTEIDVHLIDPAPHGTGVHSPDQPDYLLLNTVCGELTMFPPPEQGPSVLAAPHPNLHEWVLGRGLRMGEDGYSVGPEGRAITAYDYLPRRLLGEYLQWFHHRLVTEAPDGVRLHSHALAAVDVAPRPRGCEVTLGDGRVIPVEAAFLTTGHTREEHPPQAPGVIASPYPLPGRLEEVRGDHTIACAGFGLTAVDVVCALTLGRGGKFTGAGGERRYLPSGDEPTILLYSRGGLPYRARPASGRSRPREAPSVFTEKAVAALRERGPADFHSEILPLIHQEMRIVYESARLGLGLDASSGFDPGAALDPRLPEFADADHYRRWLTERIADDLREAYAGLEGSPLKAAIEVLRDLRGVIREAVDFGGLTGESVLDFYSRFVPIANRNVTGPQADRHRDLLAMMEAGVVDAPLGPAPRLTPTGEGGAVLESTRLRRPCRREADWALSANVVFPSAARSADPLLRSLHGRGLLSQCVPGSGVVRGVAVSRTGHPIAADGREVPWLWVWGPLAEGSTYYNHYVPSPGPYDRALHDAHEYAAAFLAEHAHRKG